VARVAPRYPNRLFELIEKLDDVDLSLAEVARRVGAAEREGITRPSSVHVRALLGELRAQRRDEREIRDAALEAVGRIVTAQVPDPRTIHLPVERALERANRRAWRRER
jgi:hypothetical protein